MDYDVWRNWRLRDICIGTVIYGGNLEQNLCGKRGKSSTDVFAYFY